MWVEYSSLPATHTLSHTHTRIHTPAAVRLPAAAAPVAVAGDFDDDCAGPDVGMRAPLPPLV
jgi:hypothetical protein